MVDKTVYKAFGAAVATRRRQMKLTQAALAAQVRMSRASIANIESGRQNVLLHHAYDLATALGFSTVHDLLPKLSKVAREYHPLSDETVTERGKAAIDSLIASALATRNSTKVDS